MFPLRGGCASLEKSAAFGTSVTGKFTALGSPALRGGLRPFYGCSPSLERHNSARQPAFKVEHLVAQLQPKPEQEGRGEQRRVISNQTVRLHEMAEDRDPRSGTYTAAPSPNRSTVCRISARTYGELMSMDQENWGCFSGFRRMPAGATNALRLSLGSASGTAKASREDSSAGFPKAA